MEAIKFTFGELRLTSEVINRLADLGYTPESLKEEVSKHEQTNGSDSPALYCGTYSKYNTGNLRGMWVDLSTFDYYEEFEAFCLAIHADEADPEIMFQDFDNMPDCLYHESMSKKGIEKIMEYLGMCNEYSVPAVNDFLELFMPEDLDRMPDAYVGVYESKEDFAEELVDDCYNLEKMMGNLACYFDYEKFARDLFMTDYYFGSRGTVFARF